MAYAPCVWKSVPSNLSTTNGGEYLNFIAILEILLSRGQSAVDTDDPDLAVGQVEGTNEVMDGRPLTQDDLQGILSGCQETAEITKQPDANLHPVSPQVRLAPQWLQEVASRGTAD